MSTLAVAYVVRTTRTPEAMTVTFAAVAPPRPADQDCPLHQQTSIYYNANYAVNTTITDTLGCPDAWVFRRRTQIHYYNTEVADVGRVKIHRHCVILGTTAEEVQSRWKRLLPQLEELEESDVRDVLNTIRSRTTRQTHPNGTAFIDLRNSSPTATPRPDPSF